MAKEPKEKAISVRLTATGGQIWDELSAKWGQSKAAVLERLLREAAKAEGVPVPMVNPSPQIVLPERHEAAA